MAVLPGFTRLPLTNTYEILRERLWPTPSQGDRLSPYIKTCGVDLSIWTEDKGDDTTAMDVDQSIRYIDLAEHAIFSVPNFRGLSKLIVRQEYQDFITEINNRPAGKRRFFLTGQPGVGKSLGACYFLFYLLAAGQSVFFISDTDWVYYFSEAGTQTISMTQRDIGSDLETRAALKRSWVLIDVDVGNPHWLPRIWAKQAASLVWTASPQTYRMHHFCKQFGATAWYMKPWSLEEITAMTTLTNQDPSNILGRLRTTGPVARSLFDDAEMPTEQEIDDLIKAVLKKNLFTWEYSKLVGGTEAPHRIFLVGPKELSDEGVVDRERPSINFLTNYITSRTSKAMEEHVETIRLHLSQAFDNIYTRSSAGKLVESMVHRALIHKTINPRQAFNDGPVTGRLELLGKAEDFVLEIHELSTRECRPLYLQPQSSTFAVVDAILITATSVFFIQCTLGTSHAHNMAVLLRILDRLQANRIEVDSPPLTPVYCLLSTDEARVRAHLVQARAKVATLQDALKAAPQAQLLPKELAKLPQKTYARLSRLEVSGVIFDTKKHTLAPVV